MPTTYPIVWDQQGEHLYETGVDHGVVYPINNSGLYTPGVAWNGLTAVNEQPSGAEANPLYADNIKYLNLVSAEDFKATLEAYTYPPEFEACDGTAAIVAGAVIGQQPRKVFGLCYRTRIGNDVDGDSHGYKLHLIYGCQATPSEKGYNTVNDNPDAITFSWEMNTTPVAVNIPGQDFKPTASLVIDSTKVSSSKLADLEAVLYGTAGTPARLPLPAEVYTILGATGSYMVTNYLTNVVNSNDATSASGTYSATLTAAEDHTIENVIVMMGGVDITDTAYSSGSISIASVTGPITIFATANSTT